MVFLRERCAQTCIDILTTNGDIRNRQLRI